MPVAMLKSGGYPYPCYPCRLNDKIPVLLLIALTPLLPIRLGEKLQAALKNLSKPSQT